MQIKEERFMENTHSAYGNIHPPWDNKRQFQEN